MKKYQLVDALKKRDAKAVNDMLSSALNSYLHDEEYAGLPADEKLYGFKDEAAMRECMTVTEPLSDWSQRFCIDVMYTYIKSEGMKTGCYEGVTEGFGCCVIKMCIARFFYIMFESEYFDIVDELEELQQE